MVNYLVLWGGRMCQDQIEPPARRRQFWKRKVNFCFLLDSQSAQTAWGPYSLNVNASIKRKGIEPVGHISHHSQEQVQSSKAFGENYLKGKKCRHQFYNSKALVLIWPTCYHCKTPVFLLWDSCRLSGSGCSCRTGTWSRTWTGWSPVGGRFGETWW